MRPRLVVVGNGMVGFRFLKELDRRAAGRFAVTAIGAEPEPAYDRIRLSSVLAGEADVDGIGLATRDWYAERGIELRTGVAVTSIDRDDARVRLAGGTSLAYDRLVLATGSKPLVLPLPGVNLPGVTAFRDLRDAHRLMSAASGGCAVVIGGGLLGLEAANGLSKRGMAVTVVHLVPWLMERQLDSPAGAMLRAALEARGLRFVMPMGTEAILGDGCVAGVRFADGSETPADLVVMAVGVRPDIALAKESGLECNRGVVVDDHLQTSDPGIFALGECAEHRGRAYGLVSPLYEQAEVLARRLAGEDARYEGSEVSTTLKVRGIDLFSVGEFADNAEGAPLILRDPAAGIYKKLIVRDARLVGAVLFGDTTDSAWYADLIRAGDDVTPLRDDLIFGQAFVRSPGADAGDLAA
jgi:nitrite reductase (NADH) large subunit